MVSVPDRGRYPSLDLRGDRRTQLATLGFFPPFSLAMATIAHEHALSNLRVYVKQLESRVEKLEKENSQDYSYDLQAENEALRRDIKELEAHLSTATKERQDALNKLTDVENKWDHMVEEQRKGMMAADLALKRAEDFLSGALTETTAARARVALRVHDD